MGLLRNFAVLSGGGEDYENLTVFLEEDPLMLLKRKLHSGVSSVVCEALFVVGNLAAGPNHVKQAILQDTELLEAVRHAMVRELTLGPHLSSTRLPPEGAWRRTDTTVIARETGRRGPRTTRGPAFGVRLAGSSSTSCGRAARQRRVPWGGGVDMRLHFFLGRGGGGGCASRLFAPVPTR